MLRVKSEIGMENRIFWSGNRKGLKKWASHPHHKFREVPPRGASIETRNESVNLIGYTNVDYSPITERAHVKVQVFLFIYAGKVKLNIFFV